MVLRDKIYQICIVSFLIGIGILFAQSDISDTPISSKGDMQFYIDRTSYRGNNGNNKTEFYLMLFADQLEYDKDTAEFKVTTHLENSTGKIVFSNSWKKKALLPQDAEGIGNLALYDQWYQILKPGQYEGHVMIEGQNSGKKGQAVFNLKIPNLKANISQVQFASGVGESNTIPEDQLGNFNKSGRKVYPNPSRRYGILNPTLYIYYELYELNNIPGDSITVQYSLINSNDKKVVKIHPPMNIGIKDEDLSIIHGLKVANVPSGIYYLTIKVLNKNREEIVSNSRKLEIIQKDYFNKTTSLTEEKLQIFGNLLKHLSSSKIYQNYENMNPETKTNFLARFFSNKDPNPDTPQNEYVSELLNRYQNANRNFSWANREGWNTDRGRVLIKYGIPDEIEKHDFELDQDPYHVWLYRRERIIRFVFGDLQGNGRFILLHSNLEEEVQNYNWQERLKNTF